jgi:hypothetical protein
MKMGRLIYGLLAAIIAACTQASPIHAQYLYPSSYCAAGSVQNTTGSISAGSNALTLASAVDFTNCQGIRVNHAGAALTIGQPTGASVTVVGTPGSATYTYTLSSLTASGGVRSAIAEFSTSTGPATPNATSYLRPTWTAPTGAAPAGYALYRKINGVETLICVTYQTSCNDVGRGVIAAPDWLPTTASSVDLPDWLMTSITSGAGTTTLTVARAATSTVSSSAVDHDDTVALQALFDAARAQNRTAYITGGAYWVTSTLTSTSHLSITGDGWAGDSGGGYAFHGVGTCSGWGGTILCADIFTSVLNATTNEAQQWSKFQITYPVRPAGNTTAMVIQAVNGAGNSNTESVVDHVMTTGHDIALQMINALDFDVLEPRFLYGWVGGLYVDAPNYPSYNQALISGGMIWGDGDDIAAANPYAWHVYLGAGGDLRITNGLKLQAGGPNTNGILLQCRSSGSQDMEPMVISDLSIEGQQNGITFNTGNANCRPSQIAITGNQIWAGGKALLVNANSVAPTTPWVFNLTLTGNSFTVNGGTGKNAVALDGVRTAIVTGNVYGCSGGCSSSTALVLGPNSSNINVQSNAYDPGYSTHVSRSGQT